MLVQSSVLLEALGHSVSLPTLFVSISRKDQRSDQLTEGVTVGSQAQSVSKENLSQTFKGAEGQAGNLSEQMHTEDLFLISYEHWRGQTLLN